MCVEVLINSVCVCRGLKRGFNKRFKEMFKERFSSGSQEVLGNALYRNVDSA